MSANGNGRLESEVDKRVRRMEQAQRDSGSLLAQSVYLGTIAGLFVVPLVAGAYLGIWLDERAEQYQVHWTVSLIVLGLLIGAVNVYLFVRERR